MKIVHGQPVKARLATSVLSPIEALRATNWNALELIPETSLHQTVVSSRGAFGIHFVTCPKLLRHILLTRVVDYPKSDALKNVARSVAGDTIVASDGETWRKMRESLTPAFRAASIDSYSDVFTHAAEKAATRLQNGVVDVAQSMTGTSYEVISDILLSGLDAINCRTTRRALDAFRKEAGRLSPFDFINIPKWLPHLGRSAIRPEISFGQALVSDLIKRRKLKGAKSPPDLLDHMLAAQAADPTGFLTDIRIRDNITTLLIAGHDTTANTLAWALYLCAFDRNIQTAARNQARDVLQGRPATTADLPELPLCQSILDETMRLYPAFPVLMRKSLVEENLGATHIYQNDQVVVPIYALHRNRLLWDQPDRFDPSRFSKANKIDKFAYMPFGAGPRVCIGARFGISEAQIILATLLSRFEFSLVSGRIPQPTLQVTLFSRNGIYLNVKKL